MDDFLEQVATRRHKGLYTLIYVLAWFVIIFFGMIGLMLVSSIISTNADGTGIQFNLIPTVVGLVFLAIAFFTWRRSDYCRVEFEYSFTNGTLDVSQVLNNKRRRYLTSLNLKEITSCGPCTDAAFQKVLREPNLKKHNWFLNRDANLYYFYFTKNGTKHLAVMELTDRMVELIRSKKYLPIGAWTGEAGKIGYGVSR